MLSNMSYWNDNFVLTTDELFATPMDILPTMEYYQYDRMRDIGEEIFSSASEVNGSKEDWMLIISLLD